MTHEKVFLITGASTGIGAATAKMAALAGYKLVLVARSKERLGVIQRELGNADVSLVCCDVGDWSSQEKMFQQVIQRFGRVDIVYANAAVSLGGKFLDDTDTPQQWREMISTNVLGAAITAKMALPHLVTTKGQLLFTGSVVARFPVRGDLYSATKSAIAGMAESIRQEMVGTDVRVTVISPGVVDTPLWGASPTVALQPDDVAAAVMYAISQPKHVDVSEIVLRPVGQLR